MGTTNVPDSNDMSAILRDAYPHLPTDDEADVPAPESLCAACGGSGNDPWLGGPEGPLPCSACSRVSVGDEPSLARAWERYEYLVEQGRFGPTLANQRAVVESRIRAPLEAELERAKVDKATCAECGHPLVCADGMEAALYDMEAERDRLVEKSAEVRTALWDLMGAAGAVLDPVDVGGMPGQAALEALSNAIPAAVRALRADHPAKDLEG